MENFIKIFIVFVISVCMILDVLIFPIWYLKPKFTHILCIPNSRLVWKTSRTQPPLPNPIMSKQLGCEKMSQICNIILHLGNKVKMGLQSHNIRRYLISVGGIGCTCDPVVRCVHTWISSPSREVESFFNVLYGKSCIQPNTHNLRNYYNFNKNNKLSQSLENLLVLRWKSPTKLDENFQRCMPLKRKEKLILSNLGCVLS
jgi:hypothetical protein